MGFESFRVELRGGPASFRDAEAAVAALPSARPDTQSLSTKGSAYHVIRDGRHAFEIEVVESPVKVSCRFTLSHPSSVDDAFLGVVRDLITWLGMSTRICDDGESGSFPPGQFAELAAAVRQGIARRRREWRAEFGDEPLAATTGELHERMILPHCQPVIRQPT